MSHNLTPFPMADLLEALKVLPVRIAALQRFGPHSGKVHGQGLELNLQESPGKLWIIL